MLLNVPNDGMGGKYPALLAVPAPEAPGAPEVSRYLRNAAEVDLTGDGVVGDALTCLDAASRVG